MHSRTCNSWQYYDYVTANPSVLANGCDNVLQRIKVSSGRIQTLMRPCIPGLLCFTVAHTARGSGCILRFCPPPLRGAEAC